MIWTPRTTVAAVIEQNGQFLLVEERIDGTLQLNQPAGHLENDESLIEAVIRETREETAWLFEPQALVGVYRWQHPQKGDTYMRFCFCGQVSDFDATQSLDEGIQQALWLNMEQLQARQAQFRSPLVMACFEDYLAGQRYSLDILHN